MIGVFMVEVNATRKGERAMRKIPNKLPKKSLNPFPVLPTVRARWIPEVGNNLLPKFKKLSGALNLVKKARDAGVDNLPHKEDTDLDETQRQVVAETQAGANLLKQFLSNQLNKAKDAIYGRKPRQLDVSLVMADTRAAVSEMKLTHAAALEDLRLTERQKLRGLRRYKKDNGLNRDAAYSDDWVWPAALVFLLIVLEAIVNSFIFKEAVNTGFLGGIGLASLFGLVNVVIGFAITGALGLRLLTRIEWYLKGLGGLITLIGMGTGFAWNLLVAHYREALERNPDTSFLDPVLLSTPSAWFTLSSVEAWALLLLGIAVFLIAVLKGRGGRGGFWDPYPDYKSVDLAYREADSAYKQAQETYKDGVKSVYAGSLAGLRSQYAQHAEAVAAIEEIVGQAEERSVEVHDSIGEWREMGIALLRAYREENRSVRTVSAPGYFNLYPSFEELAAGLADAGALRRAADEAAAIHAENAAVLAEIEGALADARERETQAFLAEIDAIEERAERRLQSDWREEEKPVSEENIHPLERSAA